MKNKKYANLRKFKEIQRNSNNYDSFRKAI